MQRRSILQNITALTIGNILIRPVWILFSAFATAEVMGVEQFGIFNFALYSMTILGEIADFGTTTYVTREIARHPHKQSQYFYPLWLSKLAIAIGLLCLVWVSTIFLRLSTGESWAILWSALYWIAFKGFEFCRAFFRANETMQYESISLFLEKCLVVFLGLIGLYLFKSASGTLLGMAIGMICGLFLTVWWQLHFQIKAHNTGETSLVSKPKIDFVFIQQAYIASATFAWIGFVTLSYRYSGILLLRYFDPEALGIYGLALRIVETLLLIPVVLTMAIFPRLSQYYEQRQWIPLRQLFYKSIGLILISSLFFALLIQFGGEYLLQLYKKEYLPALPLLKVVIWVFPIWGLNMILYQVLIASNDQSFMAKWIFFGMCLSFLLNYLLIRQWQAFGTAIALLSCEFILFLGLLTRLFTKHEAFYSKHST